MPEKTELAPREEPAEKPLVPVAPILELVESMKRFEAVKAALLVSDRDTYTIEGQERIRKSGWRKLALAFGISDEIVREDAVHDTTDKTYLCVHTRVKAWARGGRTVEGVGTASSRERPFAHLEHDLHALAHTRAKNRAIADMLGSSDLVAEELEEPAGTTTTTTTPTPPPTSPPRTTSTSKPHAQQAAVVWDFLDKILGDELADHVTVDASGTEILVKLDKRLVEEYGMGFTKAMGLWGYGVHETAEGITARISRPKG